MKKSPSLGDRTSGLLLHPTSLPGPHGSGDLGSEAFRFADWLASAGQSWWQMLPVVPPAGGSSPYQSNSAFAGHPLLLSLDRLRERDLLTAADLLPDGTFPTSHIDFNATRAFREPRLRRAFEVFLPHEASDEGFHQFCVQENPWLQDYALFCALKGVYGDRGWTYWDEPVRRRQPDALANAARQLKEEILYHKFLQYEFHRQWSELRTHCDTLGVGLIGDIPIFVAHDSADVWAHPEQFFLDEKGEPTVVAGVPPDYFSATGQRWGNALYRWEAHAEKGYAWWIARFRSLQEKFHAVRVDHFIGFHRYWEIDASCATAVEGRYMPGPGAAFFRAVKEALGPLQVIAEDLGAMTQEVRDLRDEFNFPGMRILQFAFGTDREARNFQPHSFPRSCVVYTGTHDNDTTIGWYEDLCRRANQGEEQAGRESDFVRRYLASDGREIHWDLIRLAMMSVADTAIFPVQDLLGLDASARMNFPGTVHDNNWSWRLAPDGLSELVRERLWMLTDTYARTR